MTSIRDFIHIRSYSPRPYPAHGLGVNGIYYVYKKFLTGDEESLKSEIINILSNSFKTWKAPEFNDAKLSEKILTHSFTDTQCSDLTTRGYNLVTKLKNTSFLVGTCVIIDGALHSLTNPNEKVLKWLSQFIEFNND